mmetsp:Transcript_107109/g.245180  ORF Transcript_107109/g.245180 Transcript_107109/m.245180 type:complete len:229 (+) Transcript_107109:334-1020(+)
MSLTWLLTQWPRASWWGRIYATTAALKKHGDKWSNTLRCHFIFRCGCWLLWRGQSPEFSFFWLFFWVHPSEAHVGASLLGFETAAIIGFKEQAPEDAAKLATYAEAAALQTFFGQFVARIVLENIFQLHLQISVLGLSVALAGWTFQAKTMLFSIALSGTTLLLKLLQTMQHSGNVFARAKDEGVTMMVVNILLVACVMVIYAGAKVTALFYCPDHMLNLTGCAELNL